MKAWIGSQKGLMCFFKSEQDVARYGYENEGSIELSIDPPKKMVEKHIHGIPNSCAAKMPGLTDDERERLTHAKSISMTYYIEE